jgi:aspartyl-tRNA synthetase
MSLIHASKQVVSRNACLRSSYVEISRFFRARHHGIAPTRTPLCPRSAVRSFVSLQSAQDAIDLDEKLRKTLDDFKATSMHILPSYTLVLTTCSSAISMGKTRVEA